ncbi:MAG: hypothetical protein ACREDQ_06255 [Limisphaerales bacterium]
MAVLLSAFYLSAFASAPAVYVYDSFGPGNTYSNTRWLVEGSNGPHAYQAHAENFVPGISGNLSQIQLATAVLGTDPFSNFFIAQDNGSGIPGSILESFNNVANVDGLLTIDSVTTPLLQAGQKYWFCDEPADPDSYAAWYENSQGLTGNWAFEPSEWNWYNVGTAGYSDSVFSISVVPVPEPSNVALVLLSAGILAVPGWRRSHNLAPVYGNSEC